MKHVLDANVAFKWLVPEVGTVDAVRLRDEFRNGVRELIAPDIFLVECIHSLTRAERQGRVTPSQGVLLFQDLIAKPPTLFPHIPLLPRAYQLSSSLRIGVYDCLYLALAERESCVLVTADD